MKKLALLSIAAMAVMASAAPDTNYDGVVRVAFGKVKQADGKWKDITGMLLPYRMNTGRLSAVLGLKPVNSTGIPTNIRNLSPNPFWLPPSGRSGGITPYTGQSVTLYSDVDGTGAGILDPSFPDPSSMDDLVLSNGANKAWDNLRFGFFVGASHSFLVRWRCYSTYTTGLGSSSAFSNEYADFGVIIPSQSMDIMPDPDTGTPGTFHDWTINVQAAGVIAPSDVCYMATQFRSTQANGEGPFDTSMANIYNHTSPPSVGSSQDQIWYDADPLDGIYTEGEIDNFGEGNLANAFRYISSGGSSTTIDSLPPISVTVPQGTLTSGNFLSLWSSNNQYVRAKPLYNVNRNTAPLQVVIESQPSTATALSMKFTVESAGFSAGGTQIVKLFNFSTGQYVTVDSRSIPAVDTTIVYQVPNSISQYIGNVGTAGSPDYRVRAKIEYFPPTDSSRQWDARIDYANWLVTR